MRGGGGRSRGRVGGIAGGTGGQRWDTWFKDLENGSLRVVVIGNCSLLRVVVSFQIRGGKDWVDGLLDALRGV